MTMDTFVHKPKFDVGEKVYTWYYSVRQVGEVIAVKGQKARVRFKDCEGYTKEHWRHFSRLRKISNSLDSTLGAAISFNGDKTQ